MSNERTEIAAMGEFGLIEHLTKNIELQNASSILGVGDDAAVIDHFGKQTGVMFIEENNFCCFSWDIVFNRCGITVKNSLCTAF